MNWYKQSQQNSIDINDIIWAIDDILLKEHDFSVNDLLEAEQKMNYPQEEVAKAAQVKTKKYRSHSQSPATFRTKEQDIERLTNQGFTDGSISQQLGIPIEQVRRINKSRFPKLKDKKQYLSELNEEDILDTTNELSNEMEEDISIDKVTIQQISDALGGVSVMYIQQVLKDNNVSLPKLVSDRTNKLSEMLVAVVKAMKEPFTLKDIQETFKKKHNHLISNSNLDRMLKFKNISTTKTTTKSALIFTAFKSFLFTRGVKDVTSISPEKLSRIVDQFAVKVGPEYGFVEPMDQIKLKKWFMTKIQLRDRAIGQKSNRSWLGDFSISATDRKNIMALIQQDAPLENIISQFSHYDPNIIKQFYHTYQLQRGPIITDERHPSYFLTDDEKVSKNEMNWYKKAGRGRYQGQLAGDENRPGSEMMSEIISDNELIEGEHVKELKILAQKGDWNGFNIYVQKLKGEGHSQNRINSMMTRSMHNVRL